MTATSTSAASSHTVGEPTVEHVGVAPSVLSFPGGQSAFEAFKEKVYSAPALQGEVIPADFWLAKFYDGYREEALEALIRTVQWRKEYGYYDLKDEDDKFADDVASGKLVYCGCDKAGYPILLWRVARHVADAKKIEHTVRFIVWQIERGIRLAIIKDRVNFFLDRTGSSAHHVESIAFFRLLISTLQTHFPELLQRMVLFPSNLLLQTVWKVVKPFLDVTVVQKVMMFSQKEYHTNLLTLVDQECLPNGHGDLPEISSGEFAAELTQSDGKGATAEAPSTNVDGEDDFDAPVVVDLDQPDKLADAVSVPERGTQAEARVPAAPPAVMSPGSPSAHISACDVTAASSTAATDTPKAAAVPKPKIASRFMFWKSKANTE